MRLTDTAGKNSHKVFSGGRRHRAARICHIVTIRFLLWSQQGDPSMDLGSVVLDAVQADQKGLSAPKTPTV